MSISLSPINIPLCKHPMSVSHTHPIFFDHSDCDVQVPLEAYTVEAWLFSDVFLGEPARNGWFWEGNTQFHVCLRFFSVRHMRNSACLYGLIDGCFGRESNGTLITWWHGYAEDERCKSLPQSGNSATAAFSVVLVVCFSLWPVKSNQLRVLSRHLVIAGLRNHSFLKERIPK